MQKPGILGILAYSEPCHIYKNLRIFRALTYLKPVTYSEPSQKFKMKLFPKIVKNHNHFPKALHLRSLTGFWICLFLNKHELTCRVASCYVLYDYEEPCLLSQIQTYSGIFRTLCNAWILRTQSFFMVGDWVEILVTMRRQIEKQVLAIKHPKAVQKKKKRNLD